MSINAYNNIHFKAKTLLNSSNTLQNTVQDGKYITTKLYFQDEIIYSYTAENLYNNLKNVKVDIHYLDTVSKAYFKRKSGVRSVDYGSIFLFYNGFRISPYGNPRNDWLGLDQRKSQGSSRNIGTREVVGRIDITDNNERFSVITSREGLSNNAAYHDLTASDQKEGCTDGAAEQRHGGRRRGDLRVQCLRQY